MNTKDLKPGIKVKLNAKKMPDWAKPYYPDWTTIILKYHGSILTVSSANPIKGDSTGWADIRLHPFYYVACKELPTCLIGTDWLDPIDSKTKCDCPLPVLLNMGCKISTHA